MIVDNNNNNNNKYSVVIIGLIELREEEIELLI